MLKINSLDLSDYQAHRTPYDFALSHEPGSITYTPVSRVTILNPNNQLDPLNPYSPFFNIDSLQPQIELSDPTLLLEPIKGKVLNASIQDATIVLTVEERISTILNKLQVLASYSLMTPIELLRAVVESYGIEMDLSNYGQLHTKQTQDGLQFNLSIDISDNIKLIDMINQLCVAGFMRCCIYNNKVYAIGSEVGPAVGTILRQEIHSRPTQIEQSTTRYKGGTVKTMVLTLSEPTDTRNGYAEFNQDYSGTGPLTLINPSGALSLLELYEKRPIRPIFEADVSFNLAQQIAIGGFVMVEKGILHPVHSLKARLIARRRVSESNDFSARCTFEVIHG